MKFLRPILRKWVQLLKNKKKGQKKDDKHMMNKEEMDKNMSKASVNDDTTKKLMIQPK